MTSDCFPTPAVIYRFEKYTGVDPECFMCRSVIRIDEIRMLSGGEWMHVSCAAETAGVKVRYGS